MWGQNYGICGICGYIGLYRGHVDGSVLGLWDSLIVCLRSWGALPLGGC